MVSAVQLPMLDAVAIMDTPSAAASAAPKTSNAAVTLAIPSVEPTRPAAIRVRPVTVESVLDPHPHVLDVVDQERHAARMSRMEKFVIIQQLTRV